jgi:predicted NBD/HSP70 family sugar kinase
MHFIGIDIGGTNIRSALINKTGEFINLILQKSTSNILTDIINQIKNHLCYSQINKINILGIGISIGGIVNTKEGELLRVEHNCKWNCIKIKKELTEKLSLLKYFDKTLLDSMIIDNDGNCAAYCEKFFGNATECENFITIVLGTGVGIGLYINNKIIQYSEFGYLIENKCSGKYFDSITENKELLISQGASDLGKQIADLCNIISPDKVIINGPLLDITVKFKEEIKNSVYENLILNNVQLIFSTVQYQGLVGSICKLL